MNILIKDLIDESHFINERPIDDQLESILSFSINEQTNIHTINSDIFASKIYQSLDEEKNDSVYYIQNGKNGKENKFEKEEKKIISETENILYINEKNDFEKKMSNYQKNSSMKKEIKKSIKNKLFTSTPQNNMNINLNFNFKSEPRKCFRVDDAKKHFKVSISKYATEEINNLIKDSDLPKRLKKKIHLPNFKTFTSNVKEYDNYKFLNYSLKSVFIHGKTDDNLQGSNDEIISKILNYTKFSEKIQKIKDFLSLKYKDIIKLFYKSENFILFKENDMTKFFSNGIKKEKNISLLEEDGLIKLFEMTGKKRKRDLPFFLTV